MKISILAVDNPNNSFVFAMLSMELVELVPLIELVDQPAP